MEGLVGTALPFLPTPVGTEMGAGPGAMWWVPRSVAGGAGRGAVQGWKTPC